MRNYTRFLCLLFCAICISASSTAQETITMEKKGDVYYIPGKINNLPLKFIFDTGASNVYISLTEALFMLKNGYLSDSDFGDTSYSQIANGAIVENTEVLLKEIEIGSIKINNVKAMVSNTLEAPLLLGQSAIQKLGPIQLDGNKLIIANGKEIGSNEKAFKLYNQAYQDVESGNYEEAILLSLKALEFATDTNLRAYLWDNLAWAYNHTGQKDKAIEALNRAVGEDLMAEQPAYNLGVFWFEANKFNEALRAFNNYIQRHPNSSNKVLLSGAYAYKGDCHAKLGEVKNAEDSYKKSLSIEQSSMAQLGLAELYMKSNRLQEACSMFQQALEYEPTRLSNVIRWHQYGMCLVGCDKTEDALGAFRKSIDALRTNNEYLSWVFNNGDDEEKDRGAFIASLGMNAQLMVARLVDASNDIITEYQQAFNLPGVKEDFKPLDYLRWSDAYGENTISSYAKNKKMRIIENGLMQYQNNPDLLFSYSLELDDYDANGLEALDKILLQEFTYTPLSFDYATVYNNIAWRKCLAGNNKEALPYALHSVELDSTHDYSWETLGEIHFNLGNYENCIRAMSKCIEINPTGYVSAYEFRAKSYEKLGKKKEAKKDLETIKHL